MARPPEFDRSEVISNAMLLFWKYGYKGVSISDLEAATGLRRASIYGAFGDKEALFLKVLQNYRDTELAAVSNVLDSCENAKQSIERRFASVIDMRDQEDSWLGCLMVNSIVELNDSVMDGSLRSELDAMHKRLEGAYLRTITRGVESGQIASRIPSLSLARSLTAMDMVLAMHLRLGVKKQVMKDCVAPLLTCL